jgi:hypothetical protein
MMTCATLNIGWTNEMPQTDNRFQGWRPGAFGDVWDRMTPAQRRSAFRSDLIVAIIGALAVYGLVSLL